MNQKANIIVTAINQKFFEHLKALLGSIFINWPDSPNIVVFAHSDLTTESIAYLNCFKKVTVQSYQSEDLKYIGLIQQDTTYFKSREFIETGYFSIQLWSDYFNKYKNVLFLDADTLVLKSLNDLILTNEFFICNAFNSKIFPFLNVNVPYPNKVIHLGFWLWKLLKLGIIPRPFLSANSGVMMIPDKLRNENNERVLLEILKQFNSVCSSDQEIILLYAMKSKFKISKDFRYNFQLRFFNFKSSFIDNNREILEASKDIRVIHFNGPKPNSINFDTHPWSNGQNYWKAQYYYYQDCLENFKNL